MSFFNSTIWVIGLLDDVGTSATSDCLVDVETNPDNVVVVGACVVVGTGSGLLWNKDAKLSKASKKMFPEVVVVGACVVVVDGAAVVVDTDSVETSETFACDVVVIAGAADEVEIAPATDDDDNVVVVAGAADVVDEAPATDDDNLVVVGIADVVDTLCSRDLVLIGAFVLESSDTFTGKTIVMIGATDEVDTLSKDDAECVVVVVDADSVGFVASETFVVEADVVGTEVVEAAVVETVSEADANFVVDGTADVVDTDSVALETS